MLTGKKLGEALATAITLKGVTKAELARHFKIKPPSVQDWIKNGTISKDKLPNLWAYFQDVVGPDHWGMGSFPGLSAQLPVAGADANSDVADALELLAGQLARLDDTGRQMVAVAMTAFVSDPQRQLQRTINAVTVALQVPEPPPSKPDPAKPRSTTTKAATRRQSPASKLEVKVGGGQRLLFERSGSLRALKALSNDRADPSESGFHELLRSLPKAADEPQDRQRVRGETASPNERAWYDRARAAPKAA